MTDAAAPGLQAGPAMVTPEAVALDLRPANVGSRLFAFVIDWLILSTAGGLLSIGAFAALGGVHLAIGWVIAGFVLLYGGLIFGYPIALETLWRGRTVGKAAMGLRVVTAEGAPVRFRHAAIRAALALVEIGVTGGAVAVLCVLLTRRHQRLGDLVAGTVVLRERSALDAPVPYVFSVPPGLEHYAASLDVAALDAEDYQAVRTVLVRAPGFTPGVRAWLAEQVAIPVSTRVRPPPPPGLPAEPWLACVAAVYQGWRLTAVDAPPPSPAEAMPVSWAPPPPTPYPQPEPVARADGVDGAEGFDPLV